MKKEKIKKPKKFNYRKFYEDQTCVCLPKSFDVHHIDGDRMNNDIHNLVALPRLLHRKYHTALFKSSNHVMETSLFILDGMQTARFVGLMKRDFDDLWEAFIEASEWVDYRNHLLGRVPNFHSLNYGEEGGTE